MNKLSTSIWTELKSMIAIGIFTLFTIAPALGLAAWSESIGYFWIGIIVFVVWLYLGGYISVKIIDKILPDTWVF